MKMLEFNNVLAWQSWLAENHDREKEVWLVYYKKESGLPSIKYSDTLDEALCYGWVDSIIKKIDQEKYVRKFTPRKADSNWSKVNKNRVEALIQTGKMAAPGLKKVEAAKQSGAWDKPIQKPELNFEMPPEFQQALTDHPDAYRSYQTLSASHQKQYLVWICTAKREETKNKRIHESIILLSQGKVLGLK